MKRYFQAACFLTIFLMSCHLQKTKSTFTFVNKEQGIELKENGKLVFFYQQLPKSRDGKYICNNYFHPLAGLNGDTLTEEFPADHPYHRGIYWAWHQIYINDQSIGDGWIMENIEQKVTDVKTATNDKTAKMIMRVLWKSPLFENSNPFVLEETTVSVHPLENDIRKIDFAISLMGLVPGVEIGGSDDEKGYGGLCARLKLPDDLKFTSLNGTVTPQLGQLATGPWMDFSATFGREGETSGVTILCHPQTPNYPASWILRSKTSMQNIVYPGRSRVKLNQEKPIVLYYRMIVHNGNSDSIQLSNLQSAYEGSSVTD